MAGERELRMRHELKYHIEDLEYNVLQKKLATVLRPDPNMGPKGRYSIRNLYFDDCRDTALGEKEAGVLNRKKYRIRIYNHSDSVIKFERKSKINQYILKESIRITRADADRLITGDLDFLNGSGVSLLQDFYLEGRCNLMRPVTIVEYEREAYVHPVGNLRITFDTGLRTELGPTSFFDRDICTINAIHQPGIIMEIKYDEVLPQYIRGLFPDTIRPRLAIGKFVICRTQQKCLTGSPPRGIPFAKSG